MKLKVTNEAKTGLLVLISLAALGGLILKVGNFTLLQKGYNIRCQLHYSAGVKKHAPVRLSGVDVGEVKDIQIQYGDDTKVELLLWLQDGVKVRLDSKAYVTTLGLMGEKYIEMKVGSLAAEYAKEGDLIQGVDPIRLEDLIEMATQIGQDIGQMAKDVSKLANSVDTTIQENKPKLGRIFDNLEDTSENFKDFSQDIKYHPWKILAKGKEKTKEEMDRETQKVKEVKQKNFAAKSG